MTISTKRPGKPLAAVAVEPKAEASPLAAEPATKKPRGPIQRRVADVAPNFDDLPDSAFVRLADLVRDPRHPGKTTPLPFGRSTLFRKLADGEFPKQVKLGAGTAAWRVSDIRRWMGAQA